jgi:hypothetical protein
MGKRNSIKDILDSRCFRGNDKMGAGMGSECPF